MMEDTKAKAKSTTDENIGCNNAMAAAMARVKVGETYSGKLFDEPKIEFDESIGTEDMVQKDIVDMIRRQFPKQDVRVGDTVTVVMVIR